MCGKGTTNIYWLLFGVFVSLLTLVTVSTLEYPMSTFLVVLSSMDLMSVIILSSATISRNIKLSRMALILTVLVVIKTVSIFVSSFFISYDFLKTILSYFLIDAEEASPETLRFVAVLTGVILVAKSLCMMIKAITLHRYVASLGSTILWSYRKDGL